MIEDADDAGVEDHDGASKPEDLLTRCKNFDDNGTNTLADPDSQQPVPGHPEPPPKKRGANVLYADQDIRPNVMLQSHRTTNLSVNGPQSSNLSKLPANSPHKLRQPQHPRNPYPQRFNVADYIPGELEVYGGTDYNGDTFGGRRFRMTGDWLLGVGISQSGGPVVFMILTPRPLHPEL